MLCVPTGSDDVVQSAVRVLPDPVRIAAPQPGIVEPLLVKFTVPPAPAASQLTFALNCTLVPKGAGSCELLIVVSVGPANAFATHSVMTSAANILIAISRDELFRSVRAVATEARSSVLNSTRIFSS